MLDVEGFDYAAQALHWNFERYTQVWVLLWFLLNMMFFNCKNKLDPWGLDKPVRLTKICLRNDEYNIDIDSKIPTNPAGEASNCFLTSTFFSVVVRFSVPELVPVLLPRGAGYPAFTGLLPSGGVLSSAFCGGAHRAESQRRRPRWRCSIQQVCCGETQIWWTKLPLFNLLRF